MMDANYLIGLGAVLTAIVGAGVAYREYRRSSKIDEDIRPKTKSEEYSTRASGDKTYAQLAEDAWEWADYLRRRDYLHERRFDLIEPILERCAEGDSKFTPMIDAAKRIGQQLRAARVAREEEENGRAK